MESNMTVWWIIFVLFILAMLALDLGVFNRRAHVIKVKETLWWTFFWVSLAMLFCLGIYYFKGQEKALEFLAAYLIEESLSIDNLFVFLLIFNYFGIPAMNEHKALLWGHWYCVLFSSSPAWPSLQNSTGSCTSSALS